MELIIALVGAVGSNVRRVQEILQEELEVTYRCGTTHIHLSELFKSDPHLNQVVKTAEEPPAIRSQFERIERAMDIGDALRRVRGNDFLARYAVEYWKKTKAQQSGPGGQTGTAQAEPRLAAIIHSLKRPEEVEHLRQVYGSRFFLIAVYSPTAERRDYMRREYLMAGVDVEKLIDRDQKDRNDPNNNGQSVLETFQHADFFVRSPNLSDPDTSQSIKRFLRLVFNDPLLSPTQHEHAMFLAYSASLRSADLSRQVGAVLTTTTGDIIAEGANDVPKAGGGQYWPDPDDQRDYVRGYEANHRIRQHLRAPIEEAKRLLVELKNDLERDNDPKIFEQIMAILDKDNLADITEYMRAVHAEVAAVMSCARRGVATAGTWLFCTTFPCHNCAKHIIAAGIRCVYFIEPYPKSYAEQLHGDAITFDENDSRNRVLFTPFLGVAPRRYRELFSMKDSNGADSRKRKSNGVVARWNPATVTPHVPKRIFSDDAAPRTPESISSLDGVGTVPSPQGAEPATVSATSTVSSSL